MRPDWTQIRREAHSGVGADKLMEVEKLCRQTLAAQPENLDAHLALALVCQRSGRALEALELLVRILGACNWPDAKMLETLLPLLNDLLVGKTFGQAARLRQDYDNWKAGLAAHVGRPALPRVSVIVAATGSDDALKSTLASICAQTYAAIELVVAFPESRNVSRTLPETFPFPVKVVPLPDVGPSVLLNHAVRQASGEFIDLIMSGDRFGEKRIERMVGEIARAGGAWGFSGFGLNPISVKSLDTLHRLNGEIAYLLENIRGYDTTGFALLASIEVLPLSSNLFFSRKLFDALGGFDDAMQIPHRDFALRALLEAEPFYVDEALLECHLGGRTHEKAKAEHEWTQIALQRFMAKATEDRLPANSYAPALPVWGDHFIVKTLNWKKLYLLSREGMQRCLERALRRASSLQEKTQEKLPGLDLVAFFNAEFGLAESARGLARSCHAGGIPFGARTVELSLPQMRGDRSMDPWIEDRCRHDATLFNMNPDLLKDILPQLTPDEFAGRYRIGYWYWETERIPEQWRYALDFLDEVWVATEFVAEAVRRFTDKPVTKIHPPVEVPSSLEYTRADFGLDAGRFLFLFSFDFSSYNTRKNPYAAIRAFRAAFPNARDNVGLVIKSHGGASHPEKLSELQAMIEGDARIQQIDRRMTRDEVFGLQNVCDAFVSLHRSEGLGLGLAECMALGKPVIGTAYSGNLEFMNVHNSCLVDYRLVPIRPGEYRYDQPGIHWAEPDLEQAATHMRRLVEDTAWRARIAAAGQAEIRQRWSRQVTAQAIRQRLADLGLQPG